MPLIPALGDLVAATGARIICRHRRASRASGTRVEYYESIVTDFINGRSHCPHDTLARPKTHKP